MMAGNNDANNDVTIYDAIKKITTNLVIFESKINIDLFESNRKNKDATHKGSKITHRKQNIKSSKLEQQKRTIATVYELFLDFIAEYVNFFPVTFITCSFLVSKLTT